MRDIEFMKIRVLGHEIDVGLVETYEWEETAIEIISSFLYVEGLDGFHVRKDEDMPMCYHIKTGENNMILHTAFVNFGV